MTENIFFIGKSFLGKRSVDMGEFNLQACKSMMRMRYLQSRFTHLQIYHSRTQSSRVQNDKLTHQAIWAEMFESQISFNQAGLTVR